MTASHMGARLRRLREENGLTQAAFAQSLGLSSSYLNQLERDTRPVTSRVLTTLSEVYGVDSTFFASDADTRLIAELTEALADPQVSAGIPASDVVDLVRAHPSLARATGTRPTCWRPSPRTATPSPTTWIIPRSRCRTRRCGTTSINGRTTSTPSTPPPRRSPIGSA